jgi:ribose 5-phosphate isomerase A
MDPREDETRLAAEAAAATIEDDSRVGLGTGSTVAHFLVALAARGLRLRCVVTSPQTDELATNLGLHVESFDTLDRLDVAVDGADQVAPDLWVVKGGGGAHTREKIVARSTDRFVVIASSDKPVERLRPPIPLELFRFGLPATLGRLGEQLGPVEVREGALPSPDGNVIADYLGPVDDAVALSAAFDGDPGVVAHGLFAPSLISEVLIGRSDGTVERRTGRTDAT